MKPISASIGPQPKPNLPPKPPKYPSTTRAQCSPRTILPLSPGNPKHRPAPLPPFPKHKSDAPINSCDKNLLKDSYKRTKAHKSPSRSERRDQKDDKFLSYSDHSSDVMKQSHATPGEDFVDIARNPDAKDTSTCQSGERMSKKQNGHHILASVTPTVTSAAHTPLSGGVPDVIYDEPLVDLERKTIQRLIKSDGYMKLRSDVVDQRNSARDYSNSNRCDPIGRGKAELCGARMVQSHSDASKPPGLRPCRSSESIDKLDALLDFSESLNQFSAGGKPYRSSFVDPNGPPTRRSVYIELGEYQTLLKHSRNENERVYSLPQPQCYGEDTLRAVKLITEKYDTFKRRQLRAFSFRDATCTTLETPDGELQPTTTVDSTAMENNNTQDKKFNEDAPDVAASTVQTRTAQPESGVDQSDGNVETARQSVVTKPSGSILLRDYCNTLAADEDAFCDDRGGLSRANLMRIELFYRSRETTVHVCRCLADMFIGTCISDESCPMVHQHTGVPVWLLNSGEGIRSRELLLVVAERETGFPLWQDKMNYLSNYIQVSPGVHSLRISGSLRKMVRLHMFCERSGDEFLSSFHRIASDPQDNLWNFSSNDTKSKKLERKKRRKKRAKLLKTSISQPCNFIHISCVDPTDPNFRAAFSDLIPSINGRSPTNFKDINKAFDSVDSEKNTESASDSSACEFRPRLPTR